MKNVLLTGMNFHNYMAAIIQKFSDFGYNVYHQLDKYSTVDAVFPSLMPNLAKKELFEYQRGLIRKVSNIKFDFVIVIVGRFLTSFYLQKLKELNPGSKFILVLWDDISRVENFFDVCQYYDEIFSFDPCDSSKYGFHFLPLFYKERKDNYSGKDDFIYDIYSAMACHSDREKIARKIIKKYDNYKIHVDLLLPLRDMLSRTIRNKKLTDDNISYLSRFNMINEKDLFDNMRKSKAILDAQYISQIGLTMRTFDTMSVGRKLITTNSSIRYYNFFNENNICIIDRENPIIPKEFLDTPYEMIDDDIINSYSVDRYVSVLLGEASIRYLIKDNPYNI